MSAQDLLGMYPHLQTKYVAKLVTQIGVRPEFLASKWMQTKPINDYTIQWDVKLGLGGMTQAVAMGAESPPYKGGGYYQRQMHPAFFREKQVVMPHQLMWKRKLGTLNEMENVRAFIDEKVIEGKQRVDIRVEHSLWQAILGSLSINSNLVKFDVDYAVPSRYLPVLTGVDRWTQTTSANPLDDMLAWVYLFRGSGFEAAEFIYNGYVERLLYDNTAIRQVKTTITTGGRPELLTMANLNEILQTYVGNYKFTKYDGFYVMTTELTALGVVGANTVTVHDVTGIEANDTLRLISYSANGDTLYDQICTVASVLGTTVTLNENLEFAFPIGSFLYMSKPFLPDNKVIVRAKHPTGLGTEGESAYGNFITTLSEYGEGNMLAPKPGVFAETVVNDKVDPKRIDIITGVNGLPVRYRNDDFIVATIF